MESFDFLDIFTSHFFNKISKLSGKLCNFLNIDKLFLKLAALVALTHSQNYQIKRTKIYNLSKIYLVYCI
jgi:hypothetical protein